MSMRSGVHAQRPAGRRNECGCRECHKLKDGWQGLRLHRALPSPPEPPLSVVMKYTSAVCFQHRLLLFQPPCVLPGRLYAFGVHKYFRLSVYLLSD